MAKKIKTIIKLNLPAGEATPAPPLGPALGQHGVPIMEFVREYNERTADKKGQIIPAVITIYEDRSFSFETKLPPVTELIKKEIGLEKGTGTAGRATVGTLTAVQVEKIAQEKLQDLNTADLDSAKRVVIGTARSMGVTIEQNSKH
ncbi:50S ribosomal protein L11 [Candidatus Microgenomates bacterium]|nr:50S ribosomal protein L11 [Candidatus Microgenomates bacterium]